MSEHKNEDKKVVLSGIRATGNLHLGNYYGALSKFVRMQDDYDCRYFVADLHALTTHPDPGMLHENVKEILAEYLAAGLDPEKNIIYVQSDVPEIAEMYLLMNMHAGIGELMRTASFKDKARKALGITSDSDEIEREICGNQTNRQVNAGLLTYPTLMAVDILIHHADFVPVGKDQEQHLELTRRFGRRFNSFYKTDYFHDAVNFNFGGDAVKVPGLGGSGTMGESAPSPTKVPRCRIPSLRNRSAISSHSWSLCLLPTLSGISAAHTPTVRSATATSRSSLPRIY